MNKREEVGAILPFCQRQQQSAVVVSLIVTIMQHVPLRESRLRLSDSAWALCSLTPREPPYWAATSTTTKSPFLFLLLPLTCYIESQYLIISLYFSELFSSYKKKGQQLFKSCCSQRFYSSLFNFVVEKNNDIRLLTFLIRLLVP